MVSNVFFSEITNGWVKLFVIIGVLMFVKQLPKILENLGFKLDGGFTMNPLKKLEDGMIGGKQIIGTGRKIGKGAAIGIGGAALVGGASLLTGKGIRGTGRAIKTALTGGFKGNKFGKNFTSSYAEGVARKRQIRERRNDDVSGPSIARDKFYRSIHGQTRSQQIDNVANGLKGIQDEYKNYENTAAGVDAIAKDFSKRRDAAHEAGNYEEEKRWSTAFDNRVKDIAANHGEVVKKINSSWNLDAAVNSDGSLSFSHADAKTHASSSTDIGVDAALSNIQNHMDSMVEDMNNKGRKVEGYIEITGSTTSDIKSIKNQAQGSQQSVDTNERNRHYKNVGKYSGEKKQ